MYRITLPIASNEIDFANRLKPSALFTYIQSSAAAHAEQLQLGYQVLQAAGLFFVLSWVRLEIEHYPGYRNTLSIETWSHSRHRLFSLRDFRFSFTQGEVFARARSAWLLVDSSAKRITGLERLPHPVPYETEQAALQVLPHKILPDAAAEPISEKQIGYTDVDLNQHVNNEKYIEYLLDCYPLEFHQKHQVRTLTIAYQSEARYGDRLILTRRSGKQDGIDQVGALLAGDGKSVFQALVEWERLP